LSTKCQPRKDDFSTKYELQYERVQ
jgi:hypothetical protein